MGKPPSRHRAQQRCLTIRLPDDLADAIKGVRAFGMRGINLTIPHSRGDAYGRDRARRAEIGAVNTVRRVEDHLIGENTDGKVFAACRWMPTLTGGKRVDPVRAVRRAISFGWRLPGRQVAYRQRTKQRRGYGQRRALPHRCGDLVYS